MSIIPMSRRKLLGASAVALSAPWVARAEAAAFRIGVPTMLSGATAQIGISHRNAMDLEVERINAAGGLGGRRVEVIYRDSKGQAQEATRLARELINTDRVDMLVNADSSASSFMIQEVARDFNTLCIHANSETSSLTADPKFRAPTAFRACRQGIHDSIVGGAYAASIAKAKGLKRWATASPDFAYGRDTTALFVEFLKLDAPDVEIVSQLWPKVGAPDFNEVITSLLQQKPQALYTAMYGADLSTFINQGNIYGLFGQMGVFSVNLADYTVLSALQAVPDGVETGNRYLANFPGTPQNQAWSDAYRKRYNASPTTWSVGSATAMMFVEGAAKKAGSADPKALVGVLPGLRIDCPFGSDGTVTMRADDHTVIGYAIGWGTSISRAPYVTNLKPGDWTVVLEKEAAWKRRQGWA